MQNKKKQKSIKPKKQNYPSKYKYSQEFERLIGEVNLISPNIKLVDVKEIIEKIWDESEKIEESILVKQSVDLFDECFKHFPKDYRENLKDEVTKQFVSKTEITDKKQYAFGLLGAISFRYERIRQIREDLRALVKYYNSLKNTGYLEDSRMIGTRFGVPLEVKSSLIISNGKYEENAKGIMFYVKGVEADAIRVCETCKRIFLAKRKKSKTCSLPCLNTFRQSEFRMRNKEKINRQRRENYYYKKGYKEVIDYCEKCIRPNTHCECSLEERKKKDGTL